MFRRNFLELIPVSLTSFFIKNEKSAPIIVKHGDLEFHIVNGNVIYECNQFKTKKWYLNGKLHRENDLPAIEFASGHREWHLNGKLHRENGPAIEYENGHGEWYLNGKFIK